MPNDTQRAWLTEDTYDRARIELARLLMERATDPARSTWMTNAADAGSGSFVGCSPARSSGTSHRMTASPSPAWC